MTNIKDALPTVKAEISFGQIAQIFMLFCTIGSLVWYEGSTQEATKKDISAIQRDMSSFKDEATGINLRITRVEGSIATGQSTDELQKDRMQSLVKSNQEQRDLLIKMMNQLNTQGTHIAVIENTLSYFERPQNRRQQMPSMEQER